jgi:hypothetical protein
MRMMIGTLLLLTATTAAAQTPGRGPSVPADPKAWVVEVSTSGGFTGRGKGGVIVQWDGTLACTPPLAACGTALSGESLRMLAALVTSLTADQHVAATSVLCNDCFVTTMVVRRRAADGSEIVMTYHWNDAEFPAMPPAVKRLHAAVVGAK